MIDCMKVIEIPTTVGPLFVAAGWHPGRTMRLCSAVPPDHPAVAILSNLGGLTVGTTGRGIECAKNDVAFQELSPDETGQIWAGLLHTELVGIAEVHHAHGLLYVDSEGKCYGASQIHDAFYYEGASFGEAIERLLLGRRSRPMLRPDQHVVQLYGEEFRADDPGVYKW
jgi:hypothetical protein